MTRNVSRSLPLLASAILLLGLACAGSVPRAPSIAASPGASGVGGDQTDVRTGNRMPSRDAAYRLDRADKLRIITFGEEDLSGEFEVDDTGAVSIPLVGEIQARGLTLREFEEAVRERLREGYLKDPRVSVQVLNYRPFYIIGEVEEAGEYPYFSGMNVINAVALAGGFTYRANTDKVFITRGGEEIAFEVTPDTRLMPGDVIRVPERFF
jgi:polysaccharide export outer membrane protein